MCVLSLKTYVFSLKLIVLQITKLGETWPVLKFLKVMKIFRHIQIIIFTKKLFRLKF